MDDGAPVLEVGFAIDTGGSFAELQRLSQVMDSAEAKIVADAARIEKATGGMVDLGAGTASIRSFGSAVTKEAQSAARELARVEKAGEGLSRQLERDNATYGKTRDQIRAMKVEAAAAAAEQQGLTELATRLRAQELELFGRKVAAERQARAEAEALAEADLRAAAAVEAEAEAVRRASAAYQMFEAVARQKMVSYREAEAAAAGEAREMERLVGIAARLRGSLDPAIAAQQRFDAEMGMARTLISNNLISMDEYVAKLRLEQAALDASTGAHGRVTSGANANRMAMMGASYQVQDFITQVSMGSNPINAFAVQGGQLAGQFAMIEGKAGNVARFFMSGWGLAVTAGLMVLAPFIGKLMEGNHALDDAVDKLKKDAHETEIGAQAKDRFARSAEGVHAALVEQDRALQQSIKSLFTEAERSFLAAKQEGEREIAIRKTTQALLEQAVAEAERDRQMEARLRKQNPHIGSLAGREGADLYGMAAGVTEQRVASLRADIAKQTADIATAQRHMNEAWVGLSFEQAQKDATAVGRVTREYDNQIRALRLQATEQAKTAAGVDASLYRQIHALELRKQAAIEAAQAQEALDRKTQNQIGRNIDLAEARRIAESIGAHPGSGQRSYDEQKGLYEKYRAYKEGRGPWAALAAKPGHSNHELGQALDIAKGGGMTLQKIVAAYRAAGVTLTEALDEGNHFHVAWKKVGAAAREQAKELTAAEREALEKAAVETQIVNLYKLADSYKIAGAAALVAEARVQAASAAIKRHGDVEAAVDRQIRLAIAQRVVDAQKGTAATRQQADAQAAVNAMVAAGTVPAARAAQLVQDQIADLPLLAAIQAAQQRGLKTEVERATAALGDQRKERERLRKEEATAQFNTSMEAGADQLAQLREELRLVGATNAERVHALALLRATQDANRMIAAGLDPGKAAAYVAQQVRIADETERNAAAVRGWNDELTFTADKLDLIARNIQTAGQGMADAFGGAGRAIGDIAGIYANYRAQEARALQAHKGALKEAATVAAKDRENAKFALATSTTQIGLYGDMAAAARGFFKEKSAGYDAMMAAEKVFRAVQFAMSVRAMVQDVSETIASVANSGARAAAAGAEGVANQSKLPFPFNLAAMAATAAALIAAGIAVLGSGGGAGHQVDAGNTGIGTVLGDAKAQSESIKRAVDALKEVDTLQLTASREMAASLRSIESQIGGVAAQIVRGGDAAKGVSVKEGFKPNALGSIVGAVFGAIPLIGGLFTSLFGSKTEVTASGLYASGQSLGSILAGGFDAQVYSDITKTKKFLGITTGHSYSTQYGALDNGLQDQFTLLLKSFDAAIVAAAGPLGAATADIENRLNGFVVNLGKIDLKGLTGTQIEEKLTAVFGAAADSMAAAAFPGIERFQKVGEGAFETLVRVSSTVESVTASLDRLGLSTAALGVDAKMGLAGQFDSLGAFTDASERYFQGFYSREEQAAAKAAQLAKAFDGLGMSMPATIAAYRQMVEAQDLTTAAGQSAYAMLVQLAPAFAEVQEAMTGAKSAADVLSERADLERRLLELQGDTAAIRALDLAKLDASNRALQQQIWAVQDAQEAAKAADELRKAWQSVGDGIMDEVRRIRGLSGVDGGGNFADLLGRFNAATAGARAGDQEMAKSLPGLSQALLTAAQNAATSRQELDRVRAQTAASLEATYGAISALTAGGATTTNAALLGASAAAQPPASADGGRDDRLEAAIAELRDEMAQMRSENNNANAALVSAGNKTARILENVTSPTGGNAVAIATAA